MQVENSMQGLVWKVLLVNTLSCGLEVCMVAGTVFIPSLLLKAGMEERYMTMVLGAGPILGLIFIPIIGSASDSWQGRFGPRRPFIWMLSLGVLLGLQVMPQTWRLAVLMSPQHPHWLQAALQSAVVCLINVCGNASLTLLVALLSDLFPREEENRKAFSVYAMMSSLGGCLGFLLSALDWRQVPMATYLGGEEVFIYTLLTFLFLSCLLTTVFIPEETGTREGVPRAEPESQERKDYDEGVRVASLGLFLQCVVSVLGSVLIDCWVALFGARVVYISSAALLVFTTAVMTVSDSVITITLMVAVTGYTLCVVQVLPFTLLSLYRSNSQFFFASSDPRPCLLSDSDDQTLTKPILSGGPHANDPTRGLTLSGEEPCVGLLVGGNESDVAGCAPTPQRGMCFDMAILDNAYLLSEVLPAICLGSIVQLVNSVRAYMASAFCFSLLAFLCSTRVVYTLTDLQH